MTPQQFIALCLLAAGAYQLWLFIYEPERYEHERQQRNNNIKAGAHAVGKIAEFIFRKR